MKTLHTPGPWKIFDGPIKHSEYGHAKESGANARLIAASPEMYEFIQRVAAGQRGELKGEFIANIMSEASEIISHRSKINRIIMKSPYSYVHACRMVDHYEQLIREATTNEMRWFRMEQWNYWKSQLKTFLN